MKYYLSAIKKYASFNGRARRKEYWHFCLLNIIFMIIAIVLDNILKTNFTYPGYGINYSLPYGYIYFAYALFSLLPALAVVVRRLHDQNKSGAWYFIALVPFIGGIWLFILMCTEGTAGSNLYGEDPKGNYSVISISNEPIIAPNSGNYFVSTSGSRSMNNPMSVHIFGLCGFYAGQTFSNTKNITFGRDPKVCNIIFPLEQPGISSVHCTVSVENSSIYLTDNGSTYGTFLANGTKLSANQKVMMKNKDVFYLSSEQNKFEIRLD